MTAAPPRGGARPENLFRSAFHALNGCIALAVLMLAPERVLRWTAGCAAASVWLLEGLRRLGPTWNARIMRLFAGVAHPEEYRRVQSGTWFVTALAVLAFARAPMAAGAGIAVLAFADPAAGFVGRRLGGRAILGSRTWAGSLAFVLVGAAAALIVLHIGWAPPNAMRLAGAAALGGALAELLSGPVDDNLTIPLGGAFAAWAAS